RRSSAIRIPPPALQEGWGRQSLEYYKGLPRAQSTMLLHCRTGVIGLKSYLYSLNTAKTKVCSPSLHIDTRPPNCPTTTLPPCKTMRCLGFY
ncbi:hypothetical protein CH063_06429, partial [Colletotrichum higginsianum]